MRIVLIELFFFSIAMNTFCFGRGLRAVDSANGIRFENELTWQEVLAKAKAEKKFIFVDCYATWCGPCRKMEREVYPQDTVAKVYNGQFICVKMQMDTSRQDDETIKRRYADAHYLKERYKIPGYPTFLFFTPEGALTNLATGALDVEDFVRLAKSAIDPQKSYSALLERYKNGNRDLASMSYLAETALSLGDTVRANEVAGQYLDELQGKAVFTQDNIGLMTSFTKRSKDPGFDFFYRYATRIDSAMGNDTYAQQVLQVILFNEIVKPILEKSKNSGSSPDWKSIFMRIGQKYSQYYANRVVAASKVSWALGQKNWPFYTKSLVKYVNEYGPHSGALLALSLNNYAWAIFKYSRDSTELGQALTWSGKAVLLDASANSMDTYANILYKLGRRSQALQWEENAEKLAPNDKSISDNLMKIRKGEPTWPLQ